MALSSANYTIVVSTDLAKQALALGTPLGRLEVIPPPLDEALEEGGSNDHDNSPRRPVVLYVGRLDSNKGVEHIVLAMRKVVERFPTSTLWIVGDGPKRKHLVQLSKAVLSEESFRFYGTVPHLYIKSYIQRSSVCVSASLSEGLPTFIAEAMQLGKPVVVTDVSGSRDLVKDGENGLRVQPGNSEAIADAITKLLSDSRLSSRLGERGRAFIRDYLHTKSVISKIESVYLRVTSPR